MSDPKDFRFNVEGFDDERVILQLNVCPHVSAYNKTLGVELAYMFEDALNDHRLALYKPNGGRDNRGVLSTPSSCKIYVQEFETYDPLMMRCIALEWVEEYKRKLSNGGA